MAEEQKFICDPNVWVDEYSDEFFRFAIYRVKNREVAEDLVQETFLSALKSLNNFRRDCPEKSWIYNILRNKIIDHFRKKTNQEIKQSSIVVMLIAIFTVHIGNGFDAGDNGFEMPFYYSLMLLSLFVFNGEKYSVDYLISKKK